MLAKHPSLFPRGCILRIGLLRSVRLHPLINFFLAELPWAAPPACQHPFPGNPLVDHIPFNAELGRDLIHEEPSIFYYQLQSLRFPIPRSK